MTGPSAVALTLGTTVVLDRRARILDGGAVLLGGAPPRMLRLAPAARALVTAGRFAVSDATSAALARRLVDVGIAHPVDGPGAPAARDVTVVIPVRDRTAGLARLLAALAGPAAAGRDAGSGPRGAALRGRDVAEPLPVTVIVVDDGSADPAAVRAVAEAGGAAVLRHDTSRGPAAARNTGLAAATTPLVAFLDSDVVPEPGWLAPLLAGFADPAVGLVAPRIVALPPITGALGRYEAVRSSLDLGPDPALVVPRSRVAYVPSAALLVRRHAAGAGFDEDMHVAEDVDLVLRLHAAGWRMRYAPSSRVAHDHRTTLRAWFSRKAFYGTGAAPLALRHPGSVPPLVLSPWAAAVGALLLAARWWSVPAAVAASAVAAERLARRLGAGPNGPRSATRWSPGPDSRGAGPGRSPAAPVARPRRTAARIIALGAVGAVAQTADAVTRHYWPLAAVAALASRRARRTVLAVAVGQGLADWWIHRHRDPRVRPDPLTYLLARRLDDLAYGAGLWSGALRHRTTAPLRPAGPTVRATPSE